MPLFCTFLHLSTTSESMHLPDQGHCQQSPTSCSYFLNAPSLFAPMLTWLPTVMYHLLLSDYCNHPLTATSTPIVNSSQRTKWAFQSVTQLMSLLCLLFLIQSRTQILLMSCEVPTRSSSQDLSGLTSFSRPPHSLWIHLHCHSWDKPFFPFRWVSLVCPSAWNNLSLDIITFKFWSKVIFWLSSP